MLRKLCFSWVLCVVSICVVVFVVFFLGVGRVRFVGVIGGMVICRLMWLSMGLEIWVW